MQIDIPMRKFLSHCLAMAACIAGLQSVSAVTIERHPLQSGVTIDVGQIVKGEFDEGAVSGQMLQRTGVGMTQSVTIDERYDVTVGIGGLFWYSLPEKKLPHTRLLKFGPGIGQAQIQTKLGDVSDPWGSVQFGLVPFKYNPDAKNLGEYLMRSTAYPNVLVTGGWSIINSANILIQGLNFQARTGDFTHNVLVTSEWGLGPQHDITPAYLMSYKPTPAFELGAGAAFAYLIPIKPSITTPDGPGLPGDKMAQPLNRYKDGKVVTDTLVTGYSNYTNQAIKLMARASFNPQAYLQSDLMGPNDLKIYSEVALLGWNNYPYYYENRSRRIPIMFGFNLPTFKLLDAFTVEVEYRKPEFLNSSKVSFEENGLPLPEIRRPNLLETYDSTLVRYTAQQDSLMKGRGFKWSVYAKKTIIPGLNIYTQVASDHMRGIHFSGFPLSAPVTQTWKDWYFIFRLELGI